jgi:hypothetical protein
MKGQIIASCHDYFALAAASFLHSDMNFLRSLPWTPLVSASFEHSSDAVVRAFFSAGAIGAVFAAGAGAAGGVVCANAELIKNSDAKAVAAAREPIVIIGKHLGLKKQAALRCHAEPRMNEAAGAHLGGTIFYPND